MEKQTYLAAQYLAAAGISFVKKEADDSHTNLGFDAENGCLETHPLSEDNDKLVLNYKNFNLEWKCDKEEEGSFNLDGATHGEALNWISETSKKHLNKTYNYDLHYDLPYAIDDSFRFSLSDVGELNDLMHLRILAQFILEKIDAFYKLKASIRIWPHHFDTGIYSPVPDADITIGAGLATPDSVCDEHYLYITGYKNGKAIETTGLNKLSAGEWKSEEFTGAILNAKGITESDGVNFIKAVIDQLKAK